MTYEENIMSQCITLAKKGYGKTFPNPMVGCIIVLENKIIGKGYHEKFGEAHAEVNAINSVKDKKLLREATLYVNLEPCFHFGKTPPCVDLIIQHKIKKVIIGTKDPNKNVSGKSISKLKEKCEVKFGVLEKECKNLNKKFFINQIYERPYIILKWSQTKDGFINNINFKKGIQKISCKESQKYNHKLRSEVDGIMIGKNTALYDNPNLTVRNFKGRNPTRILIDNNNVVPKTHNIFNNESKSIILTKKIEENINPNIKYIKINDNEKLLEITKKLKNNNINSLIVEGGAKLLTSFINENLWDEVKIFQSKKINKDGIKAPHFNIDTNSEIKNIGEDKLINVNNNQIIF